jgi:hypothetical protein
MGYKSLLCLRLSEPETQAPDCLLEHGVPRREMHLSFFRNIYQESLRAEGEELRIAFATLT